MLAPPKLLWGSAAPPPPPPPPPPLFLHLCIFSLLGHTLICGISADLSIFVFRCDCLRFGLSPFPVGRKVKIVEKTRMSNVLAQMLDELMGRDRNLAPTEKRSETKWDDPDVNKYFPMLDIRFCCFVCNLKMATLENMLLQNFVSLSLFPNEYLSSWCTLNGRTQEHFQP